MVLHGWVLLVEGQLRAARRIASTAPRGTWAQVEDNAVVYNMCCQSSSPQLQVNRAGQGTVQLPMLGEESGRVAGARRGTGRAGSKACVQCRLSISCSNCGTVCARVRFRVVPRACTMNLTNWMICTRSSGIKICLCRNDWTQRFR